MRHAQHVALWICAIALSALAVLGFAASPWCTSYQTVVATIVDEKLSDTLQKLGPLGWRFGSCRRASLGSDSSKFAYECFVERVARSPDASADIFLDASHVGTTGGPTLFRGGDGDDDAPTGELPEWCTKYVRTMRACFERAPAEARRAAEDAFEQTIRAWSDAARSGPDAFRALDAGCRSAWDAAKGGMGAMCPDVRWE